MLETSSQRPTEHAEITQSLAEKLSDRKLRWFAVHTCRRHSHVLSDQETQRAVELAENVAEGLAFEHELLAFVNSRGTPNWVTQIQARQAALLTSGGFIREVRRASYQPLLDEGSHDFEQMAVLLHAAETKERAAQLELLRHITGEFLKPYRVPPTWSSTVVQLAASLYDGHDCRLPLSDALEESGHSELAEHFRAEISHPKGCWVMDLILGKV